MRRVLFGILLGIHYGATYPWLPTWAVVELVRLRCEEGQK
jgi:hypothetical protein